MFAQSHDSGNDLLLFYDDDHICLVSRYENQGWDISPENNYPRKRRMEMMENTSKLPTPVTSVTGAKTQLCGTKSTTTTSATTARMNCKPSDKP